MLRIALALVTVMVAASCLPPAGQLFHATLIHTSPANPAGDLPLPVVLADETSLVVGIESAETDNSDLEPMVQVDPVDPNSFIVAWLGGMCDNDAALSFRSSGSGYALHLEVHEKLGLGCPAAGVFRGVRIKTAQPIPINQISTSGSG